MTRVLAPARRWLAGYRASLFAEHLVSFGCPCGCTEVAQ